MFKKLLGIKPGVKNIHFRNTKPFARNFYNAGWFALMIRLGYYVSSSKIEDDREYNFLISGNRPDGTVIIRFWSTDNKHTFAFQYPYEVSDYEQELGYREKIIYNYMLQKD